MKRIIFVLNNLEVGGIQKSLVELLKVIAPNYDITLFCPNLKGQYFSEIPDSVKKIDGNGFAKVAELSLEDLKKEGMLYYFLRLFFVQWSRLFGRKIPAYIYSKFIRIPKEEYDWAISYSQPLESHQFAILTNEIALYKVKAKNKATFVHCDYKNYGGNTIYSKWLYKQFDKIVAVSESVKKCFNDVIPEFKDKTVVVLNACDFENIIRMGNIDSIRYSKKCLVSVSRLSKEKGLPRCLPIVDRLKQEGLEFEWHIVGDGPEKAKMIAYVDKHNLHDIVFFEGYQDNPYRYMRNADFLFLPSLHEAAPMVFNEAMVLNLRILTTETLSAVELVADRKLGVVCRNEASSIYTMLKEALSEVFSNSSNILDYSYNEKVAEQFRKVVE